MNEWKPTRAQLEAARDKKVPDVIAPGLDVLFVGINPGLYTAAVGHHFARPGNRFWPALHIGGFTERVLSPFEEHLLPELGVGITNLVARTTARADEVTAEEMRRGAAGLARKVRRYEPGTVAVLGIGAYRTGFARPRAAVGPQPEDLAGAGLWVLPNPSGLNASYQIDRLGELFAQLRGAISTRP